MLFTVVYVITLIAGVSLGGLQLATLLRPELQFWPPPRVGGWQKRVFRVLFRVFFLGTVIVSALSFDVELARWRLVVGSPLLLLGFGLALKWTDYLGWRNAFGAAEGLKTEGIYRWSRNPIYVASIVGMLGWALILDSRWVNSLLLLWAASYILAPYLEERWLEHTYGDAFISYKSSVPRFL